MASITVNEVVGKVYRLSSVNEALEERIRYINEVIGSRSDPKIAAIFGEKLTLLGTYAAMSCFSANVDKSSRNLFTTRAKFKKVQTTLFPTVVRSTTQTLQGTIQITQNISGVEMIRSRLLQQLSEKIGKEEIALKDAKTQLQVNAPFLVDVGHKIIALNEEIQTLKDTGKSVEYLEALVRNFKGDEIANFYPEFNKKTCINERFNSFINDVKRPLLSFAINGQKVFDKSKLRSVTDQSITDCVVQDLSKHKLSISDFYKVLEFFHQGGTTQGYAYYTEQLGLEGFNPNGIGPEATVELTIFGGNLQTLVSTAYYIIANVEEAEEGRSMGIIASQGKKQCTSVYNFVAGSVNLSIATVPFEKGEIAKIEAEKFLKKLTKE